METPTTDGDLCCICKLPTDMTKRLVIYRNRAVAHTECHDTARAVRRNARKAAEV